MPFVSYSILCGRESKQGVCSPPCVPPSPQLLHAHSCSGVALSFLRLLLAAYLRYTYKYDNMQEALDAVLSTW